MVRSADGHSVAKSRHVSRDRDQRANHRPAPSSQHVDTGIADRTVGNLADAPVRRMTTGPLVREMWSRSANVTAYDACYVALARLLDAPLVTLDERLARAPGLGVELRVPSGQA